MTATAENMSLSTVSSDVENWQRLAEDRLLKLKELQAEYDEFQVTSRDFEAELERELEGKDRALKEANANHSRVVEERDALRGRVASLQAELARVEAEASQLRLSDLQLRDVIRQLEQKNDDLERRLRVTACSLEDLEQRFAQVLEEKALLSTELSEKEALQVDLQRFKDEVRDLRQELRVQHEQQVQLSQQRRRNTDTASSPTSTGNIAIPISDHSGANPDPFSLPQPQATQLPQAAPPRRSIGVSTRQAALDCVQQLINCVTMMESKVDQLKRRMDREPLNGNLPLTAANSVQSSNSASSKSASLISSHVNGRTIIENSSGSRHHMVQQVPVQSVTPRRF